MENNIHKLKIGLYLFIIIISLLFYLIVDARADNQHYDDFNDGLSGGYSRFNTAAGCQLATFANNDFRSQAAGYAVYYHNASFYFPINISFYHYTENNYFTLVGWTNKSSESGSCSFAGIDYGIGFTSVINLWQNDTNIGTLCSVDVRNKGYNFNFNMKDDGNLTLWYNGTLCGNTKIANFDNRIGKNFVVVSSRNLLALIDNVNITWGNHACESVYANATATAWQNTTTCSITDSINQNRSYQRYDTTCENPNTTIWEYRTATCFYCDSTYWNTSICNESLNSSVTLLTEENKMIALVLLYALFMVLGYWLIVTRNILVGWILNLIAFFFDFMFAAQLYKTYSSDLATGITGQLTFIFFMGFFIWIAGKFLYLIKLQVYTHKGK